jgi:hypothetical protein
MKEDADRASFSGPIDRCLEDEFGRAHSASQSAAAKIDRFLNRDAPAP